MKIVNKYRRLTTIPIVINVEENHLRQIRVSTPHGAIHSYSMDKEKIPKGYDQVYLYKNKLPIPTYFLINHYFLHKTKVSYPPLLFNFEKDVL